MALAKKFILVFELWSLNFSQMNFLVNLVFNYIVFPLLTYCLWVLLKHAGEGNAAEVLSP